jgi:uncharacterized membrane protein
MSYYEEDYQVCERCRIALNVNAIMKNGICNLCGKEEKLNSPK